MKVKYVIVILLLLFTACADETSFDGVLSITVTTYNDVWGDPYVDYTIPADILQIDGDGNSNGEYYIDGSEPDDIGTKKNFVYLYDTLGTSSKDYPVLYAASSEINGGVITIENIAPGDYYVVVFYDFNGGGNKENQLNRFDRYTIYDGADGAGSPLVADAVKVTISKCETKCPAVEISLTIDEKNTLGRTESVSGGTGRIFRTVWP